MRLRHRCNYRDLRKRFTIRCVSLFNDCHLPVPLGRGLHCNRIGSSLASEFKRVHPDQVLYRRFATGLVLSQPCRASLFTVGSRALCNRMRRGWRIPHETLLEYVNVLSLNQRINGLVDFLHLIFNKIFEFNVERS